MFNKSAILSSNEKGMIKQALFLYQKNMYERNGELTPTQKDTIQTIVNTLHL